MTGNGFTIYVMRYMLDIAYYDVCFETCVHKTKICVFDFISSPFLAYAKPIKTGKLSLFRDIFPFQNIKV